MTDWTIQTLSAKMAELAEIDLCLPESLTWDAWDILEQNGQITATRAEFTIALKTAIEAYDADPIEYRSNRQIIL